jgi:hypothetical protein
MGDYIHERSPRVDYNENTTMLPTPPFLTDSGVGSGLEGFEHSIIKRGNGDYIDTIPSVDSSNSNSWAGSFETEVMDEPVVPGHMRVMPMGTFTPTESFVAMPSTDEEDHNSLNTVVFGTPPLTTDAATSDDHRPSFTELESPKRFVRGLSTDMDFPTPRVENSTTKREMDMKIIQATDQIAGFELPFTDMNESHQDDDPLKFLNDFHGMPLVPNLNSSPRGPDSGDTNRSMDAPRSVLLEELHLIRMESGVQGPRWISEAEARQNEAKDQDARTFISLVPSTDSPSKHGGQNYLHPMFGHDESAWSEPVDSEIMEQRRQVSENEAKLREASSVMDPADDPRNSIQHIRKDLTESSDTSSSLSSKILFSELKLLEVIGGGGFGQVWSAKWKGTPVAVKGTLLSLYNMMTKLEDL